jgi:hypothetical protein
MNLEEEKFNQITLLFLKSLRGEESQSQISRRLGYNYNIYGRWENGTRSFMWDDFVKLTFTNNINIDEPFLLAFKISLNQKYEDQDIVRAYLKSHSETDFRVLSKKKIDRIIRKERNLKFVEFLLLFNHSGYFSLNFLQYFVNDKAYRQMKELIAPAIKEKLLSDIFNLMLLHIFELDSYLELKEHDHLFLAKLLDVDCGFIEKRIQKLEYFDIIKMNGSGLYELTSESERHIIYTKEYSNLVHNSWRKIIYEQSLQKNSLNRDTKNSLRGAHVIYTSNPALDLKIAEITTRMFNDINMAIREAKFDENVFTHLQVLSINFMNPLIKKFEKP